MKNNILKNIALIALLSFSFTANVCASEITSDMIQLVDLAGKQRMLSQRIAKDYMYAGKGIASSKANKQLTNSIKELKTAHQKLVASINNPEIINLLTFVEMSSEDFEATAKEEFTPDNAQLILDLSESMLEGSDYVVTSLKETTGLKASKVVDMAGRQRMLSQRIAKYYIAYQSGIKDKNTVEQMKKAVKLFSESHSTLMANSTNTPEINRELNKIDRLWKIVYKFYLNIEKGGLPLIVFNTTDDINKKMNKITALYVELSNK